jgi:hypothetical protein
MTWQFRPRDMRQVDRLKIAMSLHKTGLLLAGLASPDPGTP